MNILPAEGKFTNYIHTKAMIAGVPLNGTFELTPCCNMACKMCYVRLSREQQKAAGPLHPAEDWLKLGRIAREHGMLYLLLTGGEPFTHPQFRTIMEGLHEMGLIISINSNATLIRKETVEWLKKCPPSRINITLYGASDKTYERLCGNPHGFTQTTNAIRMLTDAGISVKLNCSVTPYNCGDLEQIFAFAEENNLKLQATSYMFPPLRRDRSRIGETDRFSPEEAAYQSARIESLFYGDAKFLNHMETMETQKKLSLSGESGNDCLDSSETGEEMHCRAGKCTFWITWEGKMLPCGMFCTDGAPNVFKDDFGRAWNKIHKEALAIRLPKECAACQYKDQCRNCAAMTYTETGSFNEKPLYRCRMAEAFPAACRRVEKEIRERMRSNDYEK